MKGNAVTPWPLWRRLRGLLTGLAACCCLTGAGFAASSPIPITAIQIEDAGTTVLLIADGAPTSSITHLTQPLRTVVDLTPARLAIRGSGTLSVPVDSSTMTKVRLGQFRADIVRVVIEHPAAFGKQVPAISQEQGRMTIRYSGAREMLDVLTPIPVPGAILAADPVANGNGAAPPQTVLADLPVSIEGDATGGTVLFKYPDTPGYTLWLERFPNRLVFETPARPAGVAPTAIQYDLTEIAQLDHPLIEGVRIYKAGTSAYTKVVCYLRRYATWTDRLTPEGVEVTVTVSDPPEAGGRSAVVPFSGRDWQPVEQDPIAIRQDQHEAEMAADAGTAAEPGIRITVTEAETPSAPIKPANGNGNGLKPVTPQPDPEIGFIPAPDPHTFLPPSAPQVAPMAERSAPDLYLFKGESVIVPVSRLVRTSIGDPEVLAVNVLSQSELLITAKGSGRTSLITWEESAGRTIRTIEVSISQEGRRQELVQVLNDQGVRVNFVGDKTVILEGKVTTEAQKIRAQLIAAGTAENVVNLIEISAPHQVLIKVRMVELSNRDRDELFRQFGTGTKTESGDFSFSVLSEILDPEFPGGGLFDLSLKPGIVNNSNSGNLTFDPLDMFLKALETKRRARILSQPNIVTLSGHEAKFRVGGEIPYTFRNENGFNVVDFREFGIELNTLPIADTQGNIHVALNPTVRTVDFGLAVAGIPGFRTRTVSTNVQMQDSQTLVIGGLLQREISESQAKVPLLGDIPFIGQLFRSKSKQDDETELLIFLTPIILKDAVSVQSEIYSEADVKAGGVADERYTFYGESMTPME